MSSDSGLTTKTRIFETVKGPAHLRHSQSLQSKYLQERVIDVIVGSSIAAIALRENACE